MTQNKYQQITEARKILALPKKATIETIKSNYRRLLSKWHPDKIAKQRKEEIKMTELIVFHSGNPG